MDPATVQRLCSVCGAPLSIYNKGDRCQHHDQIPPSLFKIVPPPEARVKEEKVGTMETERTTNLSFPRTPDGLLQLVAQSYGLSEQEILDKGRRQPVVRVRQVFMYLLRTELNQSLQTIGSFLHRDHTTVLYGCEQIAHRLKSDRVLEKEIKLLRDKIFAKTETP